ncbi:hypothetical protein GCM10009798_25770 [Nocardioides panacihumi]|uniref:Uncharacterized protein n=1 Tax=Nocardioides panacihumi TaxID=400774 RepID=A0ABP5CKE1_9ACTN
MQEAGTARYHGIRTSTDVLPPSTTRLFSSINRSEITAFPSNGARMRFGCAGFVMRVTRA